MIFLQATAFGLLLAALAYLLFRIWWLQEQVDFLFEQRRLDDQRRPPHNAHDLDGEDFAEWMEDLGPRVVPIDRGRKQ